jgi:hypothetical protein
MAATGMTAPGQALTLVEKRLKYFKLFSSFFWLILLYTSISICVNANPEMSDSHSIQHKLE